MNISNILLFIQQAASLAPCIVLCYLPFQNSLTRKRRKIVTESAFACFIVSTANLIFNATGIDSSGNIGVAMLLFPYFAFCAGIVTPAKSDGTQKIFVVAILWFAEFWLSVFP